MSVFETKLAECRERQERKKQRKLRKKYGMSKNHKENLIKSLEKQIKEAPTPELKARLTANLTRVLTTNPEARAKRSKDFGATGTSPIVAKWAERLSHIEPEAKRIECSMHCEVEERYKSRGIQIYPPTPESRALLIGVIKEVVGELTAEEQALLPQKGEQ